MTSPSTPPLSIVVMGYRSRDTICAAVSSVREQAREAGAEVLVVTSGGDDSAALVRESFPEIRVHESATRLLPGAARNAGVAAARGEVVAFLAADCDAAPGWVANRLAAHAAGYPAVAAAVAPRPPLTAAAWAAHYLLFPSRLPEGRSQEVTYPDDRVHGVSYDRALLLRLGPFAERSRIGEDTEMALRLRNAGVPVWLEASATVLHRGPCRLGELLRDQYRRGFRTGAFSEDLLPEWTLPRLLLVAGRGVPGKLRWSARQVWRLARGHRANMIRVLPWMAAGVAARQAGWARGRLAVAARRVSRSHAGPADVPATGPQQRTPGASPVCSNGAVVRRVADLPGLPYSPSDCVVALTFDDGPSPSYTPQVLSILEHYGARATFFMLGREAAHHPELVREVAGQGHAVACHGWGRVDLRALDEDRFSEEVDRTNALLSSLSGQPVLGVRPLDGLSDEEVVRRLGSRGLATILWSTDPRDGTLPGEKRIVRRAVRGLKPGSVVLLHDGGGDRRQTLAALPRILERIARRGYRTVSFAR